MHFQICGNNDGNIIHVFKVILDTSKTVATEMEIQFLNTWIMFPSLLRDKSIYLSIFFLNGALCYTIYWEYSKIHIGNKAGLLILIYGFGRFSDSLGKTDEVRFFSLLQSFWALKHSVRWELHCVNNWRNNNKSVHKEEQVSCLTEKTNISIQLHRATTQSSNPDLKLFVHACLSRGARGENAVDITMELPGRHLGVFAKHSFH